MYMYVYIYIYIHTHKYLSHSQKSIKLSEFYKIREIIKNQPLFNCVFVNIIIIIIMIIIMIIIIIINT